ncbi:Gfo/Idh/MocA family protein [Croceivirga thetidis]|nr:Gfo/Idh/MocA family oxidoreductase [Croceivirga thetidis]
MKKLFNSIAFVTLLFIGCNEKKPMVEDNTAPEEKVKTSYYSGEPLKVAVIGLTHTHVHWILGREDLGDIEIVAIVESNRDLAERYCEQHGLSVDLIYDSMQAMYASVKPEAVTAFNDIYGHLEVVEFFAPKGVPIMVEKPMAVNWEHAQKMTQLAKEHNVPLLTNYETSWYSSHHKAKKMAVGDSLFGPIQRMVFHHGHPGPIEIGCNEEFLEWLTDPVLNGAGALTDFGCYGANLATWFLNGEVPTGVTAITRNYKPDMYPKVDDDATIVIDYKDKQVIVQASWNWSHNRKDMELYGKTGYVICSNGQDLKILEKEEDGAYEQKAKALQQGFHDPFALLNQVVKHGHQLEPYDVSSLENNVLVMQILEAAKVSAETGKTISWDVFFKSE